MGSNSGFRGVFAGFWSLKFWKIWVSAILIAIKMNVDRDHDEQIPRSGRRLIVIRLSVDRDPLEDFGDRDQGLGRIAILWNFIAL